MTEKSTTDNALSFLVAGHETTAGLLSFTLYYLLKDPRVYNKAREDIDKVVGEGRIRVEHLSKLPYIEAVSIIYDTSHTVKLTRTDTPRGPPAGTTTAGIFGPSLRRYLGRWSLSRKEG